METALILTFVIGYLAIALEHPLDINKASPALMIGGLCWAIYAIFGGTEAKVVEHQLLEHFGEIASILFFLLSAMTIVELIDAHQGFSIVTDRIRTTSITQLLWIIAILAFFLSAVLDNLTTTIVMTSILRKMVKQREARLYFISLVVIAANAGGAWSPIGDVTTTMLWIGGQVTTVSLIVHILIPSLICMVVPVLIMTPIVKKIPISGVVSDETVADVGGHGHAVYEVSKGRRNTIFITGITALILVPVIKTVTHLPPFIAILMNLGIMWLVTELVHRGEEKHVKDPLTVVNVIRRIDTPSVLFFAGILLAVACLQSTGILTHLAQYLDKAIGNLTVISFTLGLLSAIVDNVPLVAAAMGMYTLEAHPVDSQLWQLIAYCAGTGGSCLIIGSAAGVAAMGMERIEFIWYAKKIAWIAFLGYLGGMLFFIFVF
ncbi:sodium:proton antiporter NhaD [Rhodoflexus caldus]|uniref:sodium:proton antiporter NhaD n=1 Tax=Rhodoflexus caldus TaxID=2891236 RepID=UPI00202A8A47|nr:sodium:proton antiporter NhaD [Rhodoflexus caldus]